MRKNKIKIMPDISCCKGQDCPLKETCYRFTVKPDPYWQSYFGETPYNEEKKDCDYYWKIKEKEHE